MGHKVNPDIFRLGVSKTWTFQLRTNKNFIKNLFLFKFLRNLFMNYTIPFFNFKKRRNHKFNDKLILRGEDQLVASPFVKNNLLFSHVYFGLIRNRIFIESFFIDVSFKQPRKKTNNIKRNPFLDVVEYKPWNSGFYKKDIITKLNKKKLKIKNKLRKVFANRIFKFVGKKSKLFKFKPVKRLSKDFYFFLRNFNPKHNRKLFSILNTKYKIYIRRLRQKKRFKSKRKIRYFFVRVLRKKKKRRKKILKLNLKQKYFEEFEKNLIKRRLLDDRFATFRKNFKYFKNLYFVKERALRFNKRIRQRTGLRYLRKVKKFLSIIKYRYKFRKLTKDYRLITLPKLLKLVSKSYYASREALSVRRGIPKNPLYLYDIAPIINEKSYTFYKNFNNLKLLKYFIRVSSFIKFFSIKKKIFFSQNLISLIMNFFGLANSSVLTKKLYLLLQNMIFLSLSFSFFNFVNFKKKFFSKFVFFKGVSKTVYRSVIELTQNNQLNFSVVGQNKFRFNSSLVLNYILIKLGQYFTIHEIVNPLSFYIKSLTSIAGYKILITGRLTRKERAAVMIRSGKRMPLSTIKANIDYSAGFKIMKFGLVGIKVYLLLNPSNLLNLYKFQFNYNAKVSK